MFKYDVPIEKPEEDILSRKNFSYKLTDSISKWDGKESLVIGLYGEWGSGKSSVINLTKYYLENLNTENKPTLIEFNPWLFSDLENLSKVFFYEIAKEIEFKDEVENDKNISQKLRNLANILDFVPDTDVLSNYKSKLFVILGLVGITFSQVLTSFDISKTLLNKLLLYGGIFLVFIDIIKSYLKKSLKYFEEKTSEKDKSALVLKKEIRNKLLERDKKLLIVIDDIDRLATEEIRTIFKLIKANADFPNTIYLLSFDRKVIIENLEKQPGIVGKDYLEKIVQVNFDIPHVNLLRLSKYLFQELNRVLLKLPPIHNEYFDSNRWGSIYHAGYKNFFFNLRNIKRYVNSLEFNISLLFKNNSMEVNPIDFFAIEAIRIFTPEFYLFIKNHKSLFIETTSNSYSYAVQRDDVTAKRKNEIENAISQLAPSSQSDIREMIKKLFPQLSGVYGGTHYSDSSYADWSKNLRICSPNYFDAYFTMIPGGDEDELAQFEIDNFLNSLNNLSELEKYLESFSSTKKLRSLLERLQDYTADEIKIPIASAKNLFTALFNISDKLPKERRGMFDVGADMEIMRIIQQILKRNNNKNENFEILRDCVKNSSGIFGPVQIVSIETSRDDDSNNYDNVIPDDKTQDLIAVALEKIKDAAGTGQLLSNEKFEYLIFRWKEWDESEDLKNYITEITSNDENLVHFAENFVYETYSHSIGENIERVNKVFDKKNVTSFISLEELKEKLNSILVNERTSDDLKERVRYLLKKMNEKDYR